MNVALDLLLAAKNENDSLDFDKALGELKFKTILKFVNDDTQLMHYLFSSHFRVPNILFLDLNLPMKGGMENLIEIRDSSKFKDLAIAVYSSVDSEGIMEEVFVNGANIFMTKPEGHNFLKRKLNQVINTYWQYHTSGLKKDNFLLNLQK